MNKQIESMTAPTKSTMLQVFRFRLMDLRENRLFVIWRALYAKALDYYD